MARTRYIKPAFAKDIDTAAIGIPARYLYENLWCHMDREGVCLADPRIIKTNIFPYDDEITAKEVRRILDELVAEEFLFPITYNGREYYYCPTLKKHQNFHKEETPQFPIPVEHLTSAVQVQCNNGATTEVAPDEHRNRVISYKLRVKSYVLREKDFEKIYALYPRKLGKNHGIKRCLEQIKTPEDLLALESAVKRYAEHCENKGVDGQYIKHFDSFLGTKSSGFPWRDWLEPDAGGVHGKVEKSLADELREMEAKKAEKA